MRLGASAARQETLTRSAKTQLRPVLGSVQAFCVARHAEKEDNTPRSGKPSEPNSRRCDLSIAGSRTPLSTSRKVADRSLAEAPLLLSL